MPELRRYDVALVGGGIMSATLGTLIKLANPKLKIVMYERLGEVAAESSDAWNNAGTGHAALCELNYMPDSNDGS
ncbi:MAG: malate:quinone oxidoreductase, partial [Aquiluna sp.]